MDFPYLSRRTVSFDVRIVCALLESHGKDSQELNGEPVPENSEDILTGLIFICY
jgi:hypothetical protein